MLKGDKVMTDFILEEMNKYNADGIDVFSFKVLEGIAKVDAEAPDMEEAQEITNESV